MLLQLYECEFAERKKDDTILESTAKSIAGDHTLTHLVQTNNKLAVTSLSDFPADFPYPGRCFD
jgi:hypothetical protein